MSTINNNIPFVPENTTDPAAGLNQALNVIDALLQIAVLGIQNEPPSSPTEGDRYIVGTTATGAWTGEEDGLARYLDGSWSFYEARVAVNLADSELYIRTSTGWESVTSGGGGSGIVETVVAGTGISVDSTDPANPVVSATGGGGGIDVPWPGRSESSTAITIDSDDLQQLIETTGASPIVTIPTEASDDLGSGFVCYGIHHGTGEVTFDDTGLTLIHPFGSSPSVPTLSPWTLLKSRSAADTWYLFGGLEVSS